MKYFSMFSGIGGFEKAIQNVMPAAECVGFSEIDKWAISIYQKHFKGHKNYGSATDIVPTELPDFDLLVGGFPCQAFSVAGKRRGFNEARGTLFFEIARIAREKRPRFLFLENVRGLLSHDEGKTFSTILLTLYELGYDAEWQVLDSADFGVPQGRKRTFIIGHLRGTGFRGVFPVAGTNQNVVKKHNDKRQIPATVDKDKSMASCSLYGFNKRNANCITSRDYKGLRRRFNVVLEKKAIPVLTPDRAQKRQNGRRFKEDGEPAFTLTAQDRHGVFDGYRIRVFTPLEYERLQGFPDNWTAEGCEGEKISNTQRYKCLGNAVTVNVIEAIMANLIKCLDRSVIL